MLHEFGPNIWIADGPAVSFLSFAYPTRMAVIRLSSGELFIWSPIALSEALRREVEAHGRVCHLVSPNKLHYLFLNDWKNAYPNARVYASPGLRKKRKDIAFDEELGDNPPTVWARDIDQAIMHGSFALTEVVFFHRESRTVLFADLVQNFRPDWFKGWKGVLARLDGIVAPNPGAPREWRASFLDRRAAEIALTRILSWPIARVVIAHGDVPSGDPIGFVRKAFGWLPGGMPRTRH